MTAKRVDKNVRQNPDFTTRQQREARFRRELTKSESADFLTREEVIIAGIYKELQKRPSIEDFRN